MILLDETIQSSGNNLILRTSNGEQRIEITEEDEINLITGSGTGAGVSGDTFTLINVGLTSDGGANRWKFGAPSLDFVLVTINGQDYKLAVLA